MQAEYVLEQLRKFLDSQASSKTFEDLASDYLRLWAYPYKRTAKRDAEYIKTLLPIFGPMQLKDITLPKLQAWFVSHSERSPVAANRKLRLLSKMFNLAKDWGYLVGDNPCSKVRMNHESPRTRFLSESELVKVWQAIDSLEQPHRSLLRLYLLTGLRRSELADLQWDQVSLRTKTITLPRTKNGRAFSLPLSDVAIRELSSLPRISESVFSITPGTKACPRRAWAKVRARTGIKDARLHDLRRTVATHLEIAGATRSSISRLLNHSSLRTTDRYLGTSPEILRGTSERLGQVMNGLVVFPIEAHFKDL